MDQNQRRQAPPMPGLFQEPAGSRSGQSTGSVLWGGNFAESEEAGGAQFRCYCEPASCPFGPYLFALPTITVLTAFMIASCYAQLSSDLRTLLARPSGRPAKRTVGCSPWVPATQACRAAALCLRATVALCIAHHTLACACRLPEDCCPVSPCPRALQHLPWPRQPRNSSERPRWRAIGRTGGQRAAARGFVDNAWITRG